MLSLMLNKFLQVSSIFKIIFRRKNMKKKCHLKNLALMGITGGVMLAQGTLSAQNYNYTQNSNDTAWEQGCTTKTNSQPYSQGYNSYNQNANQNQGYTTSNAQPNQGCTTQNPTRSNNQGYTTSNAQTSQGCSTVTNKNMQNKNINQSKNVGWAGHSCNAAVNYKNDTSWSQADQPKTWNNPSDSQNWDNQGNSGYGSQGGSSDQNSQQQQQQNPSQSDQMPSQMNPDRYQSGRMNPTKYFVADSDATMAAKANTMTEADLLPQLNDQSKVIYKNLSRDGKALALKLANNTADKNQAVKLAAQKMAEKRASMNQ